MHGLHEGDIGKHCFLVRRHCIGHGSHGADAILDRVEQRQPSEDANGGLVFLGLQRRPARQTSRA